MNIHTNWTAPLAFALLALNTVVIPAQAGVDKVTPAITVKAEAFAPQDVKLLDGPFKHALDLDVKWLLRLEPDRLLSRYRSESGLEPKAKSYDGWEGMTIAGHSLGHYLSAIARMYQNTGDAEFKRRVDYIVDELAICQQTNGNGFVGGMPNSKRVFAEVARGEIRSAGFDLNGSWVPWYNLHKLFEGLLDARRFCDNAKALEVAAKLGDFSIEVTKNLTEEQWQKMLACEHGGMNEALADLYAMTGETKYLDLAKKFYHQAILEPLAAGHDELSGKHANTQIPKIIGAARLFELTGDAKFGSIARNFYNIVLTNHTYVTGGNSEGEYFGPSGKLNDRIKGNTTETCNTYNMLKLNRELFSVEPSAKLADYYERALWNHILASQNPEDGRVLYFLTLKQGVQKQFMGEYDFTCCSGTGMENSARFSENIYMHGGNALWVNQFIASELNWAEKGLRIRQETDFPNKAATTLKISATQPVAVALQIRHPFWATNGFVIKVNGEKVSGPSIASSYTAIAREWKSGDTVEVEMP
ncbi:MAG: hypothetical protein RLY20_2292, partial [Verrucomicrobiota bacterium]